MQQQWPGSGQMPPAPPGTGSSAGHGQQVAASHSVVQSSVSIDVFSLQYYDTTSDTLAGKVLQSVIHIHTGLLTFGSHTHTHLTALFPGLLKVSRYLQGKSSLDFAEARDTEWQWHHLGHMQVCISLQTRDHSVFYRPDALPAAQPTALKH